MARPITLSNGELHVGINAYGLVHDFYFPYVGLENHAAGAGMRHKVGVWIDGTISWLDGGDWEFKFRLPHAALIGHTFAKNDTLEVALEFDDFVDSDVNAWVRNIHVINLADRPREIRLFMHQAFAIGDSRSNTDTAQYLPGNDAVLHYRGRRAFVIGGDNSGEPFDQYTVGLFGIEGKEGTWRDGEDGDLEFGNVEHGRVDSTLRFRLEIAAHSSERVHYWCAAGTSMREALQVHKTLQSDGALKRLHHTAAWWHTWLGPALDVTPRIAPVHRETFLKSLMIIKSQIDKRGAVIASTDSSMLNYSRDAYAYSWPRDGALVVWPLIRMGFVDEPRRFFEFSKRGMQPDGYMLHKYRADGALGSSWHPYVHGDIIAPPIQEDETALTLFMFAQFYAKNPDAKLLADFYDSMVRPMADFMAGYTDAATGLPKPSYDLWEEVFETTTFTTATVHAALLAASDLAREVDDKDSAIAWRSAAEDIQRAAHKHLFNHERQAFYKGIVHEGDTRKPDDTLDNSAVFGAFIFGLFSVDSEELRAAVETHKQVFGWSLDAPGLPRYEDDYYNRVSEEVTGNWWFITSLWLAQHELEVGEHENATRILDWTREKMLATGVLSEQISPLDGELVGVTPLTWSHAEYVATLLDSIAEPTQ